MAEPAAATAPGGLVLGRYRPLRPLGSGGSGSVWLARDESSGLDVALKMIAREGKAASRAEREARAATLLRHERCMRALSFGSDARHVYIAYEYAAGRTLRQAMRAGALSDAASVDVAAQILEGLDHAHGRGIVHRDVKPSNVLLADGSGIDVRLLDFGLAHMEEAETLTEAGDVPGTLAYIAPERLRGAPASPAADVWAVGVILWESLAGRHPFWTASLLETARAIEDGAPSLGTERPDLPKALIEAVDRALSVDPAQRPPARALAEALSKALADRRHRRRAPVRVASSRPQWLDRLPAAGLAALFAGWTASALPFFPAGWFLGLALACALAALARERVGVALALAVPILPLGNVGLGVALLYAGVAGLLLVAGWRRPRTSLLLVAGPPLAVLSALALLPLLVQPLRSAWHKAFAAVTAVLAAGVVAGLRHDSLPFTGEAPPRSLDLAASEHPMTVARALWAQLGEHSAVGIEALVLGAAAVALPHARRHGLWGIAGFAAGTLALALLSAPAVAAAPIVAAVWLTAGVLVALELRAERRAVPEAAAETLT